MKHFKVRDLVTGNWMDKGTYEPVFNKTGKVWRTLGSLRAHFTQLQNTTRQPTSPLWEIVEYDMVESDRYPAPSIKK